MKHKPSGYPSATLAGGCFWCTEYAYRALNGVLYTRVGYMGGAQDNPSYEAISTGRTGHAEVIEVTFDPEIISYRDVLLFFLTKAHDPTQLNRQGVDIGTQYRSAIFPHSPLQEAIAKSVLHEVDESRQYRKPLVTTIEPLSTFWEAEDYHQGYYEAYEARTGRQHIRVLMKGKK